MRGPGEHDEPGHEQGSSGASHDGADGAARRMRAAIAAATAGNGSRDALQAAARDLVRELRAKEQTPEGALVQIKTVLASAGLRPTYMSADPEDKLGVEAQLYRDVIGWSIQAYYDER